jgi:hypothetical protein
VIYSFSWQLLVIKSVISGDLTDLIKLIWSCQFNSKGDYSILAMPHSSRYFKSQYMYIKIYPTGFNQRIIDFFRLPLGREVRYIGNSAPRGCTKDEGRPLGVGLQEQAPNHLKLLW